MKTISVLGATGSIGDSTLDVVARHPDRYRVHALSAHRNVDKLLALAERHRPEVLAVSDAQAATGFEARLHAAGIKARLAVGPDELVEVAGTPGIDAVMAAIVGAAGLPSALAAARSGKTVYLANKETLVVSGSLFTEAARQGGARVLPVDSEHNAVFQALPPDYFENGLPPAALSLAKHGIRSLILTASGGPFLDTPLAEMEHITPAQAVKHPNWSMGRKISVDSATMMNKGLELIEAHWLFSCPPEKLETVIHPQSVIHSMVRYLDGSVLAQMGCPDMRIPIAHCLGLSERIESGADALDFARLSALTFRQPDHARFPCLKLAYGAMQAGGGAPCVLNAANEAAVAAFLDGQIRFTDIARTVEHSLAAFAGRQADSIDELFALDAETRRHAQAFAGRLKS